MNCICVWEALNREASWPIRPCWHDIHILHILPQYLNNFSLHRIENQKEIGGPSSNVTAVFLSVSLLESSNISTPNEKCVYVCVQEKGWVIWDAKKTDGTVFLCFFISPSVNDVSFVWLQRPYHAQLSASHQQSGKSLRMETSLASLPLSLTHRYFSF